MKWINIIGLCLQFFAFWLAAPELLGAETMKRFESGLVKFVSRLPSISIGLIGLFAGIGMAAFGIYSGLHASENSASNPLKPMILIGVASAFYMLYMIFFYKKLQNFIEQSFAKPLIEKLINNSESRKTALVFGAILFTAGFVLQLIVLVMS
jgi:hypothetical protein